MALIVPQTFAGAGPTGGRSSYVFPALSETWVERPIGRLDLDQLCSWLTELHKRGCRLCDLTNEMNDRDISPMVESVHAIASQINESLEECRRYKLVQEWAIIYDAWVQTKERCCSQYKHHQPPFVTQNLDEILRPSSGLQRIAETPNTSRTCVSFKSHHPLSLRSSKSGHPNSLCFSADNFQPTISSVVNQEADLKDYLAQVPHAYK